MSYGASIMSYGATRRLINELNAIPDPCEGCAHVPECMAGRMCERFYIWVGSGIWGKNRSGIPQESYFKRMYGDRIDV